MKSSAAIMVALISLGPSATQEALGFDGSPVNTDPLPDSLPDSLKRFAAASKIANNTRADSFFDPALTQLRVYLTAPVQDDFRRVSASKFSEGAEKAGFSSFEAKSFSDSMASGEIRFEPGGQLGSIVSRDASLRIGQDRPKVDYLLSFRSVQSATAFFEKYSTIKLIVNPAPPRDYKVIVNGEECPATEAGTYKVMPGESVVNATRPSKPQCEWHGPIAPGAVQEVNCSL